MMEFDFNDLEKDLGLGEFDGNFLDGEFKRRLQKTLYYGKSPLTERTSLPVTELTVKFLQHAAPSELGKIDTHLAASISRKACISPCSLMLGLIYIDRLRQRSPEYLQQVSSADLFLVAMMVASKFLNDDGEEGVYNDEWAESAGLPTESVNELERDFLHAIDWNLLAHSKEFDRKLRNLEQKVALVKGRERKWRLSYTDLWVILRNTEIRKLVENSILDSLKVLGVVTSAYLLGFSILWISTAAVTGIKDKLVEQTRRPFFIPSNHANSGFLVPTHEELQLLETGPIQPRTCHLMNPSCYANRSEPHYLCCCPPCTPVESHLTESGLPITSIAYTWSTVLLLDQGPNTGLDNRNKTQIENAQMIGVFG